MKIKNSRWILGLFVLLVAGCATRIGIQILKPAQLNIGPIKKIAVMDFEFRGNWAFWQEDEKLTFEDIAKQVLVKQLGLEKDKVRPPDPLHAFPGRELSQKFIAGLVENGHYNVMERTQLEKILAEHQLAMTGVVDETKAAEIGRFLGVEAMILGMGSYTVSDGGDWKEYTKKEKVLKQNGTRQRPDDSTKTAGPEYEEREVKYMMYQAIRTVNAELTYRVVNVTTGQIIVATINRATVRLTSEKARKADAYSTLPPWKPGVDQAVNSIINQSVRQIAPYNEYQMREIKKGKTPAMKVGLEYAKRGMMEEARASWEQVLQDNSKKGRKDQVAAWYNLGIYYEVSGNLDKAEEIFEKCFKMSGKPEYLDHKARIISRKKELERLEQQNQNNIDDD